jgi:hypothetical protein
MDVKLRDGAGAARQRHGQKCTFEEKAVSIDKNDA